MARSTSSTGDGGAFMPMDSSIALWATAPLAARADQAKPVAVSAR